MIASILDSLKRLWRILFGPPENIKLPWPSPLPPPTQDTLLALAPPGHGKTTFLWSAFGYLSRLDRVVETCFIEPLKSTRIRLKEHTELVDVGLLPLPTEMSEAPYELVCHQLPAWGDCIFRVSDGRDAALSPSSSDTASLPARSAVVLVLLDPDQWISEVSDGRGLAEFAERMCAVTSSWGSTRPHPIVIAIAKADRIVDLPPSIRQHLESDPLAGLWPGALLPAPFPRKVGDELFSPAYMERLEEHHETLREWIQTTRLGGVDLLQIAAMQNWDLYFCAISATGTDPVEGDLLFPWAPKRVLDPLFWCLAVSER